MFCDKAALESMYVSNFNVKCQVRFVQFYSAVWTVQCAGNNVQGAVCSVKVALCSVQCLVSSVHRAVFTVQYTAASVICAL